jgi:hypothetical protein
MNANAGGLDVLQIDVSYPAYCTPRLDRWRNGAGDRVVQDCVL